MPRVVGCGGVVLPFPAMPTKRSKPKGKSRMLFQEFEVVERLGPDAKLACPRKDCGNEFTVNRKAFKESRPTYPTRSCPFCFKVSLIPGTAKGR